MGYITTQAVVLRYADYKEADRMVTLFSPDCGKISAVAKGVKKQKAKLRYAAELFHYGEYIFAETHGRLTLTQCTSKETFFPLRDQLDRLWSATLMLNVCEAVINEGQENETLFKLLLEGLYQAAYNEKITVKQLVTVFLLKTLNSEGFAPELNTCCRCGKKPEGEIDFSFQDGGICCAVCSKDAGGVRVSQEAVQKMKEILDAGHENVWELSVRMNEADQKECYKIITRYVQTCLDKRFKVLEYLLDA